MGLLDLILLVVFIIAHVAATPERTPHPCVETLSEIPKRGCSKRGRMRKTQVSAKERQ